MGEPPHTANDAVDIPIIQRSKIMIRDYFKYYRKGRKFVFRPPKHRWMRIHMLVSPDFNPAIAFDIYYQWERICDEKFKSELKDVKQKRWVRSDLELTYKDSIFIPKIYLKKDIDSRLTGMLHLTEARRNYATLCYLTDNGVKVPRPLMILEGYRVGIYHSAVLFMEKLPSQAVEYKIGLQKFKQVTIEDRLEFLKATAASLANLHNLGVYTEDTDKNMAVTVEDRKRSFYYYDFDNFYPWRVPIFRRTAHAVRHYLLREIHPFSELEIKTFVDAYIKYRNCPADWKQRLLQNIEERYPELALVA